MASKLLQGAIRILHRRIKQVSLTGLKEQKCYLSTILPNSVQSEENKSNYVDYSPEPVGPPSEEDAALDHDDYFGVKQLVNIYDLFEARVHLGHKYGCRNRRMKRYIYGNRLGIDIFNLDNTLLMLHNALNITAHVAYRDGLIMFVSANKEIMPLVESTAKECGEYAHCRPWMNGTFTNSGKLFNMAIRHPDLCIFINTLLNQFERHEAIAECSKMLIPSVGIVDSNCNPFGIDYLVPGNDDTIDSLMLYCGLFKEAILRGKEKRKQDNIGEN